MSNLTKNNVNQIPTQNIPIGIYGAQNKGSANLNQGERSTPHGDSGRPGGGFVGNRRPGEGYGMGSIRLGNVGVNESSNWEESLIANLNPPECVTTLTIFSPWNDYPFSQVTRDRSLTRPLDRSVEMKLRTLVDTGANLSFITISLAKKIEKEFLGVRGTGRYKVIDAFLKAHYFVDNISFRVKLNTGNPSIDTFSWTIKAVIVDIDFTAEFILGLHDIKRIRLFKYIPELVEEGSEEDETQMIMNSVTETADKKTSDNMDSRSPDLTYIEKSQRSLMQEMY